MQWTTAIGRLTTPHPLTDCPKPDAQGPAPKASFAVLRSQIARPNFGQKHHLQSWLCQLLLLMTTSLVKAN